MNKNLMSVWTPAAITLGQAFDTAGHEVRVVGGAVRDALAGREPKDTDLAATATPAEMLALGVRLGLRTIPTLDEVEADPREWEKGGLKHGTVPFVIDGEVYEVTTLRFDTETNGRHAVPVFLRDFRADADRRDFTINAMSVGLDGRLWDYHGGAADLADSRVRFVGDAGERIRQDYLRILRWFRFRARLCPAARLLRPDADEQSALAAIFAYAEGLDRVSGERFWLEMSKMLGTPAGVAQLPLMAEAGVTDRLGLDLSAAPLAVAVDAAARGADPRVVLGLLLRGGDAEVAVALATRWRLSQDDFAVADLSRNYGTLDDAPLADWLDLATRPRARPDRLSLLLDGLGRHADAHAMRGPLPVFPLKGGDVVAAGLAAKGGAQVGEALESARILWRDSDFRSSGEELLAAMTTVPAPPHP